MMEVLNFAAYMALGFCIVTGIMWVGRITKR